MTKEDSSGDANKLYLTLHAAKVSIQRKAKWDRRQESFIG